MGAVPVAATLKVAVWPAVIVALAGCEEIAGATAVLVVPVPVPFSAIEIFAPKARTCRVAE